jgi:transcriptional regulator GlxA family with amidase domain
MKEVTILGLYNAMATTVFGPMDILNQAGRLWNRVMHSPGVPLFNVIIASVDTEPIRLANNIHVQPHCHIADVQQTDLIIIPSANYLDKILQKNPQLIPWLCQHYEQGAHIASICTGVFLLAETGLLNGKTASLHWGFADMFRKRYPQVKLDYDQIFIDHGRLYCSAGVSAGLDLSLYLVEKFCGRRAAVESAKTMILDMGRQRQAPYECFLTHNDHGDPLIAKAQKWMELHQAEQLDYESMAKMFCISRRSLERRFNRAVGDTPLGYLQKLRVESAKRLLEEGMQTFGEIACQVGYEDISFFRKLFTRLTGLRPKEYQQRFTGYFP